MADTKNTTEPTDEQMREVLNIATERAVDRLRGEVEGKSIREKVTIPVNTANLIVGYFDDHPASPPSAPTEDDREALVASLRYGAGQLGKQHPSYGCAGCSICTARNTMEEAADELEARRSPVPPSAPTEPYPVDLIVQIVSESGPMPSRGVLDEAQRKYSISEAQAKMALSRAVSSKRLNRDRETWEVSAPVPPSAPTPDEDERDALVVEYEVAWSDFEALGEENRDLRWRDFLLDRLITAGYRSTPTPDVAALIAELTVAGESWFEAEEPPFPEEVLQLLARSQDALAALRVSAPETVTTVEELDALPIHVVLKDRQGDVWESFTEPNSGLKAWGCTGDSEPRSKNWIALPARVLFRPTREETDRG